MQLINFLENNIYYITAEEIFICIYYQIKIVSGED